MTDRLMGGEVVVPVVTQHRNAICPRCDAIIPEPK
jgi:hypothetical protein